VSLSLCEDIFILYRYAGAAFEFIFVEKEKALAMFIGLIR
jgi:hypothetical protein